MNRVLLLGKDGQIGWELQRVLAPFFQVFAFGRRDVDLSCPPTIRSTVRSIQPHIIINAAAYTAVDRAEQDEAVAFAINSGGPEILSAEAKARGALLVHYSTDYVFDGRKTTPYVEDDIANPLGVYGRSKRMGEMAIESSGCRFVIFRTSWIYGVRGHNFLLTMLRLANSKPELRVVNDQTGVPNWSRMVAQATGVVLLALRGQLDKRCGIYHLSAGGQTSWHAFAEAIVARGAELGLCRRVPVIPISTREYPTATRRPVNSVLSHGKLEEAFGITFPDWQLCLGWCTEDLATGLSVTTPVSTSS